MKVFFIGTVEFSKKALQKLIDLRVNIVGVATKRSSVFNSDFADLSPLCIRNNIPYKFIKDINGEVYIKWIKSLKPDFIFCFGWSNLLDAEVLKIPQEGTIGFHPASLPQNRGRHPLIWPLVLGLKKSASTFFFMDEGIDSGDILTQEYFTIDYKDNAGSLMKKVHKIALKQIEDFIPKLENRTYRCIPQDHSKANVWRKRTKKDGEIDFRMDSGAIYNLVRALTKPYVGAHLNYKNREIKIWQAEEKMVNLPNIEYGKVLDVKNRKVLVKCFNNAILLTKHEFKKLPKIGEYL